MYQTPPPSYEAVTGIPGAQQQKGTNPFIWYPHQASAPPPTEYRSAYNPTSYPASSNLTANNVISQQISNDRPSFNKSAACNILIYFGVIGIILVIIFLATNGRT